MYQRATTKKCLISTKLFYRALVTRVNTDHTVKARRKKGFDDVGNTNGARKARHVLRYKQQQLNRRRKPQEPINKLKEAEFFFML